MKSNLIISALFFSFFFSLTSQKAAAQNQQNQQKTAWTDKTRILPDTLRRVPVGITLYHSPNPNYPEINNTQGAYNGKYIWKHSTFIRAEMEDLEVVAAGSFIWFSEKGWFTNVQYDKKDFADKFACKNGILKKGEVYCFKNNFRFGDNLYGGDALWFVLAKDKNGKIYKGMGLIETEDKLISAENSLSINQKSYEVNRNFSKVNWTGYGEIGDYSLTGDIKLKKGNLQLNEKTNDKTNFNGIFIFEVSKFPTASFELINIQNGNATGFLTIKNVKKSISFPIKITEKTGQITVNGIIPVDRTLFGITYNSKSFFKDLGDQAIKNIFDLKFEIVAEKVR